MFMKLTEPFFFSQEDQYFYGHMDFLQDKLVLQLLML